ncbi:IS3 family transposase [Mycolicibacterium goodii]|nr:IS3 family transposase [Mycolicibacterium goodii]
MRAWLRSYATKHPCHGFRRAWAALRYDERREVHKKKIHRLWREEGLQVRVNSPRKRAGVSSIPRSRPTHRTWCGRSISSSTPPSTARPSRSPR